MNDFTTYLERKDLADETIKSYKRQVDKFSSWLNKDIIDCSKRDVFKYFEYLMNERENSIETRKTKSVGLNYHFRYLLETGMVTINLSSAIDFNKNKRKVLHRNLFSSEELHTLVDDYNNINIKDFDNNYIPKNQRERNLLCRQRNYIMLGILLYQGVSTNELQLIRMSDIDIHRASIHIRGNRRTNSRTLSLDATQIGSLVNYIDNVRPLFFKYCDESDNLFFSISVNGKNKNNNADFLSALKPLVKELKIISLRFKSFNQVRTSVITNWLKSHGVRKAQYYAGHRFISSTEEYKSNDIDELAKDISKYNPF